MTGYTVHTGSTVKFSSSWDRIFTGAESSKKSTGSKTAKTGTAKQLPKKTVATNNTTKVVSRALKKVAAKKRISKSVKRGK